MDTDNMERSSAERLAEPYAGYEGTSMHVVEHVPGLTYRMLDYWTRCGHIKPLRPAKGSGTHRIYDVNEYPMMRRAMLLLGAGVHSGLAFSLARRETVYLAPGVAVSWATELLL